MSFLELLVVSYCFFFFQAEDGIRDFHVTGVQTCALPILSPRRSAVGRVLQGWEHGFSRTPARVMTVMETGYRGLLGAREWRSEEHTSELQSRENLVCR